MENNRSTGAIYTASDLMRFAGLTYRQLHDWETRAGVIDTDRVAAEGWRRFTTEEVLALCVCAALRRDLSLPLDRIGPLYGWLSGKQPDAIAQTLAAIGKASVAHMEANPKFSALLKLSGDARTKAFREHSVVLGEYVAGKLNALGDHPTLLAMRMAELGFPAYLVTDFHSHMILQERNAIDALATRFLKRPTIVFPLNDLFNELRKTKNLQPFQLDHAVPSFLDEWRELQSRADVSPTEQKIIKLIRGRTYQRITVHVKEGVIIQADLDEEVSGGVPSRTEADILDLIRSGGFQTIKVQQMDGTIVRIGRKRTIKFDR